MVIFVSRIKSAFKSRGRCGRCIKTSPPPPLQLRWVAHIGTGEPVALVLPVNQIRPAEGLGRNRGGTVAVETMHEHVPGVVWRQKHLPDAWNWSTVFVYLFPHICKVNRGIGVPFLSQYMSEPQQGGVLSATNTCMNSTVWNAYTYLSEKCELTKTEEFHRFEGKKGDF